jgi:hypothetical protein
MFKTGTTSFGQAMTNLGLRSFTGPWVPPGDAFESWDFDESLFLSQYGQSLQDLILKYDTFNDYPFMFLYEWLAEMYPDAVFVLLYRDPMAVAISDRLMWERYGIVFWKVPRAQRFIDRYMAHIARVRSFFSSNPNLTYLECSVSSDEDFAMLCRVLAIDDSSQTMGWPHTNKGTYSKTYMLKIRVRNVKHWLKQKLLRLWKAPATGCGIGQ